MDYIENLKEVVANLDNELSSLSNRDIFKLYANCIGLQPVVLSDKNAFYQTEEGRIVRLRNDRKESRFSGFYDAVCKKEFSDSYTTKIDKLRYETGFLEGRTYIMKRLTETLKNVEKPKPSFFKRLFG